MRGEVKAPPSQGNEDGGEVEEEEEEKDAGEGEEEQQQPQQPPPQLSLADRIQPWAGACDAGCLDVLMNNNDNDNNGNGSDNGSDGDSPNHPLVLSFHCLYNPLREYWFLNGQVVRMGSQEMKERMVRKMMVMANGNSK